MKLSSLQYRNSQLLHTIVFAYNTVKLLHTDSRAAWTRSLVVHVITRFVGCTCGLPSSGGPTVYFHEYTMYNVLQKREGMDKGPEIIILGLKASWILQV